MPGCRRPTQAHNTHFKPGDAVWHYLPDYDPEPAEIVAVSPPQRGHDVYEIRLLSCPGEFQVWADELRWRPVIVEPVGGDAPCDMEI